MHLTKHWSRRLIELWRACSRSGSTMKMQRGNGSRTALERWPGLSALRSNRRVHQATCV